MPTASPLSSWFPIGAHALRGRCANGVLTVFLALLVWWGVQRQQRIQCDPRRTAMINQALTNTAPHTDSAHTKSRANSRQQASRSQRKRRRPSEESCKAFLSSVRGYFGPEMRHNCACPHGARWFEAFRKIDPAPSKNFVNIGCNKGGDTAAFLHRWDPHFTAADWNKHAPDVFSRHSEGICGQTTATESMPLFQFPGSCPASSPKWGCRCQNISDVFGVSGTAGKIRKKQLRHGWEGALVHLPSNVVGFWEKHNCSTTPSYAASLAVKEKIFAMPNSARPIAYCVELMPKTFEALKQIRWRLSAGDQGLMVLDNFAVGSGFPSQVTVSNVEPGTEYSGIGIQSDQKIPVVNITHVSLDSYTESKNLGNIDFVLIDTEGNDPMVILGGARTLQRTRFVAFENHKRGAWLSVSLRSVIDFLDILGFDCFWTANDGTLWEVTGCYPFIKTKAWSNIGCAKRGDVFLDTMRSLADANGGLPPQ